MIWIGYTTLYRTGGSKLAAAARTLAAAKRRQHPERTVRLVAVERKAEFIDEMVRAAERGGTINELHLLSHSGMYGPMFGTTKWPEQFSPHEWRSLEIPFAEGGEAFFHACRTARWFAPFFARTFSVPAHGYHWYTTFSSAKTRFRWEGLSGGERDRPLYLVGCIGKKSHGLLGSVAKYGGLVRPEAMKRFDPEPLSGESSYDSVAALYDAVFSDIRVREDEWRWLSQRVGIAEGGRVLDIGCGNGALLGALSARIGEGVGVDRSAPMIAIAQNRNRRHPNLSFETIDGPKLPFPDNSFDMAVSLCSFRYLDWDPLLAELHRVVRPEGRFLVVDMVTAPLKTAEVPKLVRSTLKQRLGPKPSGYRSALERLVGNQGWQAMLKYNPIRAEHEFRWYLESRFPGHKVELLNVGLHARVLAFDSGPIGQAQLVPQTFP